MAPLWPLFRHVRQHQKEVLPLCLHALRRGQDLARPAPRGLREPQPKGKGQRFARAEVILWHRTCGLCNAWPVAAGVETVGCLFSVFFFFGRVEVGMLGLYGKKVTVYGVKGLMAN